jgi:hypothetical protein
VSGFAIHAGNLHDQIGRRIIPKPARQNGRAEQRGRAGNEPGKDGLVHGKGSHIQYRRNAKTPMMIA